MESSSSAKAEFIPEESEPIAISQYVEDFIYDFSSNNCKQVPFREQDFLGPCKVAQIPGKGRGLVATQNIHPGQLVIAEKALAIVHQAVRGSTSKAHEKHVEKFKALQESLLTLVKSSLEHAKQVLSLHAGPELGHISSDESEDGSEDEDDEESEESTDPVQDLNERTAGICVYNSFEGRQIQLKSSFSLEQSPGSSYGLWYFPSFLNHACFDANCHWSIFGNLMIVRSTKVISEGEELLISYIDPHQPYKKRVELCANHNFECDCLLCNHNRKEGEGVRRERQVTLSNFRKEVVESEVNYDNIELIQRCIANLKSLQSVHILVTKLQLIKPLMQLGLAHYVLREWQASAESFAQVYECCIPISQFALFRLSFIMTIITCLVRCHPDNVGAFKENAQAQDWKQKLRQCLTIQYGAHTVQARNRVTKMLEAIRPSFVEEMQSNDLLNWLNN